jgi:glutaconate CoA-transferase, subunit B
MSKPSYYTDNELLAVLSARELKDGQVIFAGIGIPLLAACLAQRSSCPGLTILFEGGVIGASVEPGLLPPSTNDQRGARRANMVLGSTEVLLLLQRGYVDIGFIGAAQIDRFGNLNSSVINARSGHGPVRLPGSGGGNDIASLTQLIVAMKHQKRRFVERVEFVTSPGWLRGRDTRSRDGLTQGGTLRVITDLAVFGFDPNLKQMEVEGLNPGVSLDEVRDQTGFDLLVARDLHLTEPPTETELRLLRSLDPDRLLLS